MKTKHRSIPPAPVTQSGDQALNNPIRRKWFALALGGFLFISVFALLPSSAQADCSRYDVSGEWTIFQGSYTIPLSVSQNGKTVSGTATQVSRGDKGPLAVHGSITGTVEGYIFDVQINWPNGGAGVYRGSIYNGYLQGNTYDKSNPSSTAGWYAKHHFVCADAAPVIPKTFLKKRPADATNSPTVDPRDPKTWKRAQPNTLPMNQGQGTARGFINGLQLGTPTPTPSAEADESSSSDTEDQQGKHKKNKKKKKHHHHDDDENQGND